MKDISVVMTTYMHGRFIRAAIESVLAQTFKDYELIIINDGSPDNTDEEILKVKDPRIAYIKQAPSGLPAISRNRGISRATGRLIAFFDGDDTWHPSKLERSLEVFREEPVVDILCHDLNLIKDSGKILKRTSFGPYEGDVYRQLLVEGNSLGISGTVMKRSIFSEDTCFFSEDKRLFTVEDYELWLRLAKSRRYHFYYLPEILGEHRVFEESASLANAGKNASNMVYLLEQNLETLATHDNDLKKIIKKKKSKVMFGAALAYNYRREFSESVKWHLMTIKEYPIYSKPYLTFLATILRIRLGYI
ncbi:MAG: hypothetical protein A2987_06640 [Omnitrophica bacterium RIFCSPLOWO2_01_FULL_45_10]|nr:MAG: hypothetical protein A2987_06640 [Omnitrophica bacterium RIFCSPLOWO2_01_FULL_45_10]